MTDPALLGLLASDANRLVEIVFLIVLSASSVMNLYLGFWRVNQSHGKLLFARRLIGTCELWVACAGLYHLSFFGHVLASIWIMIPVTWIEIGIMIVGVERIKVGRDTTV